MRAKYGLDLGTGYEIARNAARIPLETGLGYYYGTELGAGLGLDETAQRRIGTYGAISSGLSSAGTFMDSLWKRREAKERNAYLQSLDYVNQPYDRYAYNSNLGGPLQGNYFKQGGYISEIEEMMKGGLIKRADGSYSQRGLWDNIRANKGSGRKPTKEMLEQERKIKAKMEEGGSVRNGTTKRSTRQGKKMAVYMDGTWHHFGDSSMDDYRTHKSEKRREAFYSRHKKNLQGDSPRAKAFRVYARKTWQDGGMVTPVGFDPNIKPCYKCGGKVKMQEGGEVDFYDSDPEQLYIDHIGSQNFNIEVPAYMGDIPLTEFSSVMPSQNVPPPPKGGTIAVTHNNPGNIKFGKFAQSLGAQPGRPATDGGIFAVFPNLETGLAAQRRLLTSANYRNLTVNAAMKRWSNSGYGGEIYPSISNKKMADLTESELKELQRRQIKREDGNMYRAIYGQ